MMEVYLNDVEKLSLFKEFPFLLGFIPRGVSGIAKIYDFRNTRHDRTVVYGPNKDGEWEEVSEYEALTRKVKKLCRHLNSDAIYDGIINGVRLTIYKEVEEEFYKFFFIVRYDDI